MAARQDHWQVRQRELKRKEEVLEGRRSRLYANPEGSWLARAMLFTKNPDSRLYNAQDGVKHFRL